MNWWHRFHFPFPSPQISSDAMNVPHRSRTQNDEPPKNSMVRSRITYLAHLHMRVQYVTIVWLCLTYVCWFILHSIPILAGYFLCWLQATAKPIADMARKSCPGCSSNEWHHIVSSRRRSRWGWEARRDSCHFPGWPMVWKVLKQALKGSELGVMM